MNRERDVYINYRTLVGCLGFYGPAIENAMQMHKMIKFILTLNRTSKIF